MIPRWLRRKVWFENYFGDPIQIAVGDILISNPALNLPPTMEVIAFDLDSRYEGSLDVIVDTGSEYETLYSNWVDRIQ